MSALPTPTPTQPISTIVTQGMWFGDARRPALGWLSRPVDGVRDSGIVLAPPIGYAYASSHRTLRVLAECLAGAGHTVLRIDYDGTGDSAGDQWDPDRLTAWRETVRLATDELRRIDAARITLLGVRLGGTLALLEARGVEAERAVAWMPVLTGRRFSKELRLLSQPVPTDIGPAGPSGTRVTAGNVFSAQTLSDLESLVLTELAEAPAISVLMLDDAEGASQKAVDHLRSLGTDVTHLQLPGGDLALETAPEFATVPEEIVGAACAWLGPACGDAKVPEAGEESTRARFSWRTGSVEEQVIRLGSRGHVGLITQPKQPDPTAPTLVFLNPGSETHIGPGRAWVEYARDLALTGHRSVRVDFLGWGESPDAGRAPGRPYNACGIKDTEDIVRDLQAAGHERVVICGLCASAWIALQAALTAPVAGVIAMNPQLYWKLGDPVQIDWDLIRAQRAKEIKRIDLGARAGAWTLLDLLGHRSRAASWLDQLEATGIPIRLLFAEGDDGLVFLTARLRRRLARVSARRGRITVTELPEIDHPMHMTWLRPRVVQALQQALESIGRSSRPEL